MEVKQRRSPSPPPSQPATASPSPHQSTAGDPPRNAEAAPAPLVAQGPCFSEAIPSHDDAVVETDAEPQELGLEDAPAATVVTDADAAHPELSKQGPDEAPSPPAATLVTNTDADAETREQAPSPPPPAATVLTDELREKIVRQVEYYFSDTNLPTDKFMLKYVNRDKHGFVPIAVISSFRKIKKLVQDFSLIVAALRTSSQLVVNTNGTKVKRLHPLLDTEVKDDQTLLFQPCTVIVENLPDNCSKDCIKKLFGNAGNISNITIHDPHSVEESATARKGEIAISSKLHALVDYETVEAAERAVASLNDEKNWRSGMRVELLRKRMEKYGLIQRGHKENHPEKGNNETSDAAMNGQKTKSKDHQDETVQTEDSSGVKGRRQSWYRSRGRGQNYTNGQGHGHVQPSSEGTGKPILGPKMPDGTRGFAMGRGSFTLPSEPPDSILTDFMIADSQPCTQVIP